jgi:predicted AAA+ superfamily ATPase
MYKRLLTPQKNKSFFLFGPRGTGKTTWLKRNYPQAIYLDFLKSNIYTELLASPQRLETYIPPNNNKWIILDEVQRIPEILNEVHRLIENNQYKFILTGSSARKLKRNGVNLLAGRALTYQMYPFTALELKEDFSIEHAINWGLLPATLKEENPQNFLESYIKTYLEQEIQQEGLTRNLANFSRFLETASFSQGSVLNISEIARESFNGRKLTENYFSILEDLMIAYQIPIFTKRAKRKLIKHPKFYFFDVGVFKTIKPQGPLDIDKEINGAIVETLVLQQIIAINHYLNLNYKIYYWRTINQTEVDFILYGPKGIIAIEVKSNSKYSPKYIKGLNLFSKDYPEAKKYFIYTGKEKRYINNVKVVPIEEFLLNLDKYLQ